MSNPLKSALTMKCPNCGKGNLFVYTNPYRFSGFFDMPDSCENCGQNFQLEPGFYYGAMYVNYGITVAISVSVFVAMYVLGAPWELHEYLIGIAVVLLGSAPYTFRLARAIWLHMFAGSK